jgi:large subunit ribosomal protein L25
MIIEKRTQSLLAVRKMKKVPGVLFGRSITPVSVQMDELELHEIFKSHGTTLPFLVKLGKETHQVYIKGIQKDVVNHNHFLNVELLKVGKGDIITAKIPLHVTGMEILERKGWVVQIIEDAVEAEFEMGKGIAQIEVDVSNLKVKDVLHIKDVPFPKGIKIQEDLEKALIHIAEPRVAEVVPEKAEEPATMEAEVAKAPEENK